MTTNYSDFYKQYIEEKQSATIDDRADDKGWFRCVCPMHPQTSDKKDAGIHEVSGVLHCFVEEKIWTPAEFLHDYMEYSYEEADEIVAFFQAEHSLMKQEGSFTKTFSGYKPKFEALHLKSIDLMSEDHHVVKEYMRARGIYYKTLLKYNVGYLPKELNGWGRDCLVFPYFHAGRVVALRYRDVGGNKGAEPGSFMTLWNLDKLIEGTRIAVICEGESDCIRTAQALGDDYVCVSAPQAIFRAEWKREFSNVSQVIIIPQDDAPSKKMATDAKTHLDGIKVINLPWGPREYGKDTVDWLRYHSDQELLDLVQGSISRRIQTVMDGPTFLEESKKPREWMIEGLLSRGQICMIAGPPKSAKCTSYDTVIELSDGSHVEAKDLIGQQFEVQSFDFDTMQTRKSLAFAEDNGLKTCYEIKTDTGKLLKRTGNHPLIARENLVARKDKHFKTCEEKHTFRPDQCTGRMWKNCEDLVQGEFILVPEKSYSLGIEKIDKNVLKVVAYLIGDGSLTKAPGNIGFSCGSLNKLKDFTNAVEALGGIVRYRSKYDYAVIRCPEIKEFLMRYGLCGSNSHTKRIPKQFWMLDNEHLGLFINTLFGTDTHIYLQGGRKPIIDYYSVSEGLARDVQRALHRFGIRSVVHGKVSGYRKKDGTMFRGFVWICHISTTKEFVKFTERIGCAQKDDQLQSLLKHVDDIHGGSMRVTTKDTPVGFRWERIKAIRAIENEPTVAICVPGNNTYITPDACEHNTFVALNLMRSLMSGELFLGMRIFKPIVDPENLYNMLLWEEEGPLEELRERYEKVFAGTNWLNQVYTAHQLGLKLDEDKWIERLVKEIEQKKIDLLIIDPFARCYGVDDENSASQMGQVWSRIASIMNRFPRLSIVILHHFSKSGNIEDGGKSMRGSSRSHGEYDLGILTGASKTPGIFKVGFEARSIPQPVDAAGNKVFTLEFNDGIMVEASQSTSPLPEIERPLGNRSLKSVMAEKGEWALSDAADYYNTTVKTISAWIDKTIDPQTGKPLMERTKPSKGNPVIVKWLGYSQEFENLEETT